jgi:hypothetical protein
MITTNYPNFAIDNVPFRASNTLPQKSVEQISKWRAFDGTLNIQKWDFKAKKEMVFEFNLLTEEEFITLKDLVNSGFHLITSNIEGALFSFQGYLEFFDWDEGFAKSKRNIKVKVYEK